MTARSRGPRPSAMGIALVLIAGCAAPAAPVPSARPAPVSAEVAPRGTSPPHAAPDPVPATPAPPPPPAASSPALEPREGFRDIEVPGFRPALAWVPPGPAAARFPLAVVTHGAGGMPEPHCERWRLLLHERAYILCPRGTAIGLLGEGQAPTGYFYRDHRALGREVLAARAAAIAAFGPRLDPDRALYVGFSQGATMGALFLHELASTDARGAFATLVLVDGGWLEWTRDLARKEHETGLERVLLVCGQARCAEEGRTRIGWMKQAGLPTRFEYAQGAGHTWAGAVGERVDASVGWLLEGDARFAAGGEERPR